MSTFANRYLEIKHSNGLAFIYLTPLIDPPNPITNLIIPEVNPSELSVVGCPLKMHIPYLLYDKTSGGFLKSEYEDYVIPIINNKIANPAYQSPIYVISTPGNISSFNSVDYVKLIMKTYYTKE